VDLAAEEWQFAKKNSGWQDRSFCTTREALLRCVRAGGESSAGAIGLLVFLVKKENKSGFSSRDVSASELASLCATKSLLPIPFL